MDRSVDTNISFRQKIEIEQEIQKWESEHNDENKEIELTISNEGQHLDWKQFNQELLNKLPRTPIHRGRLEFIKEKTHETEQEKAMHK